MLTLLRNFFNISSLELIYRTFVNPKFVFPFLFSKPFFEFFIGSFSLQASLRAEKQRADDSERRCAEAWEVSEKRLKKLEETERRVYQLQDSLNR